MKDRKLERKKAMKALIRNDILDSAVSVVLENGMAGLTMDAVAANAGIAKGTLYLYFKNKQALLNAVVDYSFDPIMDLLEEIINSNQDPVRKLEECARVSIEHTEKNITVLRELKNVLYSTMDQFLEDKDSWYWIAVNHYASALDEAVKMKILRPMNSKKIAALFVDSINTLMSHRIFTSVSETIEEDIEELMNLYVNGLALHNK